MPNEPEAIEIPFSDSTPPSGPGLLTHALSASTASDSSSALCEIVIERDLAVQLVGSDAGRCIRIKPHSSMTKGASPEEFADVRAAMDPFLRDEIQRVHQDKTHRPKVSTIQVKAQQALALKAFCKRYADFLQDHLDKHPGDENLLRGQQRLNQANRVIARVNSALRLSLNDARSVDQLRREAIAKVEALDAALTTLKAHADAGTDQTITPLLELQEAVRRCLALHGRS